MNQRRTALGKGTGQESREGSWRKKFTFCLVQKTPPVTFTEVHNFQEITRIVSTLPLKASDL